LMKKNSEALADPWIDDFEDKDKENVGDNGIGNDTVGPTPLQRNEPPSKRRKNAQGASSS
ncbi:hypothetical protein A2U01_0105579, partial [Trifolium medium]|nr:hypothetical protein [Trifolium medium]